MNILDISSLKVPSKAGIQALISKNIRLATERESKLGVGVNPQAQKLFDALSKTCTCAWKGANIVVFGEFVIEPPYTKVRIYEDLGSKDRMGSC
jgi:hypothetical protein